MKKLHRRARRFKGFTVGLDLHKRLIWYTVMDRRGNEVAAGRIEASPEALLRLLTPWRKQGAVQVAFEASGCFLWVFDLLVQELGREQVHVAQAAKIMAIANSQEKNDENDAWWLAYLLWDGRLPEAFVAEGALRELRIAGRELRSYTDLRSDLVRRVRSHLAQLGVSLPKGWHTSEVKREAARTAIEAISGMRGAALRELYEQVVALTAVITRWHQEVKGLCGQFPEVQAVQAEMPGLKTVTAGLLYGELGSPGRYHSEKAYAKATGLTPGSRTSAGKDQQRSISRAGSRHARWALTRAVIACLRCKRGPGAQVRAWVEKQCARQKCKRKVIVAAARKLAEGVWRLLAWGEVFDLRKAFPT
jgi:transposase